MSRSPHIHQHRHHHTHQHRMSRRKFLLGAGAAGIALPAAFAWGYDPDSLVVERHKIVVPGLEKPLTAVQISDIHADLEGSCSEVLLQSVTRQIQIESPDMILATGDYITRPGDPIDDVAAWLARMHVPEGVFAVLGNHDSPDVKTALEAKGIQVLSNVWTKLHGIALAGVGDLSRWPHEPQKVLATVPNNTGTVLLAHQPDSFWSYDEPVTLQISGHTHGGQATFFNWFTLEQALPYVKNMLVRVPELEPLAERSYLETQRGAWSGFFYRPDGSTLYVNRGLGRMKRISFWCPPELTVWELVPPVA
jgi:uncharacterized protein